MAPLSVDAGGGVDPAAAAAPLSVPAAVVGAGLVLSVVASCGSCIVLT